MRWMRHIIGGRSVRERENELSWVRHIMGRRRVKERKNKLWWVEAYHGWKKGEGEGE